MSSTTGKNKIPLDGYYTPLACARALVRTLDLDELVGAVEPSVGAGAFAIALQELANEKGTQLGLCGVDLNPAATGLQQVGTPIVGDWMTVELPFKPDLILGNPPFTFAEAHVRRALQVVAYGGTVAFLLRLAFLESEKRIAFWSVHPVQEIHALVERPSFTGGETDSCPYGFFVWQQGWTGETRLTRLSWKGAPTLAESR